MNAVLRLLRCEPLEELSRELRVGRTGWRPGWTTSRGWQGGLGSSAFFMW